MKTFVADFETTVYDGQESTEVWASAMADMDDPDDNVFVFHSISETLEYIRFLNQDVELYYHNLKFDGNFWLWYLIHELHFKQGYEVVKDGELTEYIMKKPRQIANNEVVYVISDMGQWYTITFKYRGCKVTLKDSLKLLPFSVKKIGKDFKTKHQKLEMEYKGKRYAGCEITTEELQYIKNDVLVMKEALQIMFSEGHNKLTIGSCCLAEYKRIVGRYDWQTDFPRLDHIELDPLEYGASNADEYIRKSYKGGWCYLVEGANDRIYENGTTADVNSLYPSMMSSESGNIYPHGKPCFFKGEPPEKALLPNRYYFIRIRTRFYLKKGKLPFIQIKGNPRYKATEMLTTSDFKDRKTGKYYRFFIDKHGQKQDSIVELTLTCTDWKLVQEHYNLVDLEILDGCWFYARSGMFDEYINKYKEIKMTSKGAQRQIAKLFLNNLYGKMATSPISSFKVAYMKEDESLGYEIQCAEDKEPVYIAAGSAITSYSRNFTIRAAQANFHGADKKGFKYADTDSIHCDLEPDEVKGIKVDDNAFCCWKLESQWDKAIFVRQKTYIEHITHEDRKPIEKQYYNIKAAGMPQACKDQLNISLTGATEEDKKKYKNDKEKLEFITTPRTLTDFKTGLTISGKLLPRCIKGGVILEESYFTLRGINL
jgi:hypothetical protein